VWEEGPEGSVERDARLMSQKATSVVALAPYWSVDAERLQCPLEAGQ
jgi:hypothetical protein